jgi:hypothetical protein
MKSRAACSSRTAWIARSLPRQPYSASSAATRSKNTHLSGGQEARLGLSSAAKEPSHSMICGSSAARRACVSWPADVTTSCQPFSVSDASVRCSFSRTCGSVEASRAACAAFRSRLASAISGWMTSSRSGCGASLPTNSETFQPSAWAARSLLCASEANCSAASRASTRNWNASASSSGRISLSRRA